MLQAILAVDASLDIYSIAEQAISSLLQQQNLRYSVLILIAVAPIKAEKTIMKNLILTSNQIP